MAVKGARAIRQAEQDVIATMEKHKKRQLIEEKQIAFDQTLASKLHKTRKTTTEQWIQENPDIDLTELDLGDYTPTAANISANTITGGGATGSAASPNTVASVAATQITRSAATPEELQAVPPKPDQLPGGFHPSMHIEFIGTISLHFFCWFLGPPCNLEFFSTLFPRMWFKGFLQLLLLSKRTPTYPWSIPHESPNPQMKGIPS